MPVLLSTSELLSRFPRVALAHLPTPLEFLPRLSEFLAGPRIFIKRDDQTGLALGGNKVRKLEFLVAQALDEGCDTLVTIGGVQSNHARQTAAAAAKLGLRCELVLPRVVPRTGGEYEQSGNVLLDHLFGARLRLLSPEVYSDATLQGVADELRRHGRKPLLIPTGGSSPRGALGYFLAADEFLKQAREQQIHRDAVVVPTGSAGTTAGLVAGLHVARAHTEVIAAAVSASAREGNAHRIAHRRGLSATRTTPSKV
jgi:L-cysteate sulfo-lyase